MGKFVVFFVVNFYFLCVVRILKKWSLDSLDYGDVFDGDVDFDN